MMNFKKAALNVITNDGKINEYKRELSGTTPNTDVNHPLITHMFENIFWDHVDSLKEFENLTKKVAILKEEMGLAITEVDPHLNYNIANASEIELTIKKSGNNPQFKTSYLHCAATHHALKHHLLFMFTAHLIRLLKHATTNGFTQSKRIHDDSNVIQSIFFAIFPEKQDKKALIFDPQYDSVLQKFLAAPDNVLINYPIKMFYQGLYMEYVSETYPYLLDTTQKKLKQEHALRSKAI
jgi:hypothetical protein